MAKDDKNEGAAGRDLDDVVSVIGPGMEVIGDVKSDGTIRVEGRVEGSIKAGKSVVVGRDGTVDGDIETQDVVVAGRISGTVVGESRVELKDSCHVEGDIRSRRIKLDEGGRVEGRLQMGVESGDSGRSGAPPGAASARAASSTSERTAGAGASSTSGGSSASGSGSSSSSGGSGSSGSGSGPSGSAKSGPGSASSGSGSGSGSGAGSGSKSGSGSGS